MKASNNVGIICVIFVLVITVANASQSYAQTSTSPQITISTDAQSYVSGDTIVISGTISTLGTSDSVILKIINPNNELVDIESVSVTADGKFSETVLSYGPSWKNAGTYLVQASYLVKAGIVKTAETSFNFGLDPGRNKSISASIGPMINCEKFSFQISFSAYSETNLPVVIEIIDPDGNVVGRDKFDFTGLYMKNRIIEINWGKDGRYLIQTNQGGEIFHNYFGYDKPTPENLQSFRMGCLKEKYVEPVREKTYSLFNFIKEPGNEDFWKNVQTADELLSYYDPKGFANHYQDYVSQKTLKSIRAFEKKITNSSEIVPVLEELRVKLPDLIEKKVISIFQDGEKSITNSSNMTLNEKTDLIFDLRHEINDTISYQRNSVSSYIDGVHSIYTHAEAEQQYLEHIEKMSKSMAQKELDKATQTEKEKESIKQELLTQNKKSISSTKVSNKNVSKIPTWIKNNAKWWSDGSIGDVDFIKGIEYLIKNGIMNVSDVKAGQTNSQQIPSWIKNNAGWWANGQISDDEFVKGIQWLVSNGIIKT